MLVSKVNCNLGSLDSLGNLIALNTLGLSLFGSQMACHFDLWFKAKTTIKCFSCTVYHHVFLFFLLKCHDHNRSTAEMVSPGLFNPDKGSSKSRDSKLSLVVDAVMELVSVL